jgi:predicted transcriptional regulator of viral defense system
LTRDCSVQRSQPTIAPTADNTGTRLRHRARSGQGLAPTKVIAYITFVRDVLTQLYALAEPQAGYFTTAQALEAGIARQYLQHHLRKSGKLIRVGHGIYRLVQFPEQTFEDMIVACLWAGPESAVSHESALAVFGLGEAMPAVVHLTTRPSFRGRRRGVLLHPGVLAVDERTIRDRVPVTGVERTLADIARTQPAAAARELAAEAMTRGLTSERKLGHYVAAHPDVQVLLSKPKPVRK